MLTTKQARERWIKALRSGKYKQTQGHLKDDAGYCCLGIACEVLAKPLNLKITTDHGQTAFEGNRWSLPRIVSDLLDIKTVGKSSIGALAHFNDRGWSFKRIATYLESGKCWNKKEKKK